MVNSVMLVGRLVQEPEIFESETGKQKSQITVAVPRPFKNADGVYETDFVDCILWDNIAINASEYCHKGDTVGIRGRLQTNVYETKSGEKRNNIQIMTEKLTFLSSKWYGGSIGGGSGRAARLLEAICGQTI